MPVVVNRLADSLERLLVAFAAEFPHIALPLEAVWFEQVVFHRLSITRTNHIAASMDVDVQLACGWLTSPSLF
eukprot:CAMPEP_0119306234 /NCGR_PEP_ID=MMETSP1333-20130426/7035_1 /TAXON_ID=418940 /ORGANISM="Scyphosphaera apsteinii, Strain RCC1455" /LENGTH=72 /DNA_ID=CAMNT_0007309487 /DNA_START=415 /DNA_END=633 /DNA_ORIENTATION=+